MTSSAGKPAGLRRWLETPRLSPERAVAALSAAVVCDAVQIVLGPAGWVVADQVLDVLAMAVTSLAIGFHPLLLPTFILELIPVSDVLPTWTGCVTALLWIRRRQQRRETPARGGVAPPAPLPAPTGDDPPAARD